MDVAAIAFHPVYVASAGIMTAISVALWIVFHWPTGASKP